VQLNDTHPALCIPELLRLLVDEEGLGWDEAWDISCRTFGYTNHTVLPEALEKWRIKLLEYILPRHLQIIYEINHRWMEKVGKIFPGDLDRLRELSIIEESDEKKIRMAHLSIIGSHSVNGVAALHTEILKNNVFKEFHEISPEKFNNKTNGITQRRWLKLSNPALANLISNKIGEVWITDLYQLKKLEQYADEKKFQREWELVKLENKKRLAYCIKKTLDIDINVHSIFDVQVKRIHEYKRQLLNIFHVITLYNRLKKGTPKNFVPRTFIFGGKAAPAYSMAKHIIKLINSVAEVINSDPEIGEKMKVVFIPNYSVSSAQIIIPAADLSQQISTAGMEASGTGNMKFALNGALTIGTLDGANIEILQEVGKENIFIFGLTAKQVQDNRLDSYDPMSYYHQNTELRQTIDMIKNGYFSPEHLELFHPIIDSLLNRGDHYMVMADFANYLECQESVAGIFQEKNRWIKMSILNVANMGKFSSDRTIKEYANDIWKVKPIPINIDRKQ
jgi:starch phosphorylase